jgi:catechol 2,3-dioxygenase
MSITSAQPIDARVNLGHFHLRVGDVDRSLAFYSDVLGFDVVADMRGIFNPNWGRAGDATFFSAGGYHHHLGINTWNSAGGASQADPGAGIHHAGFLLPSRAALGAVVGRLLRAGVPIRGCSSAGSADTVWVEDPDGIGVALAWDSGASAGPGWTPDPEAALDLEALAADGQRAERSTDQGFVPAVRTAPEPIDPRTRCGHAHLRMADLDEARRFYVDALGWRVLQEDRESVDPITGDAGGIARLSVDGRRELLAFDDRHSAGHPRVDDGRTGLHHIAIRYPTRTALGDAVRRLRTAGFPEPPGAWDADTHLAAYYDDPDGNTVELHHDYPREQWRDPYSRAPSLPKVELDELVALADRELPVAAGGH